MDKLTSEELIDCYQKQARGLREWSLLMLHDWKSIPTELENFPVDYDDDTRDSLNEKADLMLYYFGTHGAEELREKYSSNIGDFIKELALHYFYEADFHGRDELPLENRQSFLLCAMEFAFLSFLFENYHLIKQGFGIDGPRLFNILNNLKDDVTYETGRLIQHWISRGVKLRFDLERTRKSTKGHQTSKDKRKRMALQYYDQIKRDDLSLWAKAGLIKNRWAKDSPTQRTIYNYLVEEGKADLKKD
jgi:hypothetical protein